MQTNFILYGTDGAHITFDELCRHNASERDLIARAENSGSEGCYCEVARWNEKNKRWERFAFAKFFGGEHPARPLAEAVETAELAASDINGHDQSSLHSFVHCLPDYSEDQSLAINRQIREILDQRLFFIDKPLIERVKLLFENYATLQEQAANLPTPDTVSQVLIDLGKAVWTLNSLNRETDNEFSNSVEQAICGVNGVIETLQNHGWVLESEVQHGNG